MKKIILNAVIITVSALFFGCTKNTPDPVSIVSTSNKVDYSYNKPNMRTIYWIGDIQSYGCSTPPTNCFPDLIVSSIDAKIFFTNLNDAIKNNNQELFLSGANLAWISFANDIMLN